MKVLTVATNDLRIYDGTTIRITGLIKGVSPYTESICLASKTINEDLQSIVSLKWLKLKFCGYYTQILTCYSYSAFNSSFTTAFGSLFLSKDSLQKIHGSDLVHAHFLSALPIALACQRESLSLPVIVDLHGLYCLEPLNFGYEPIRYLTAYLYQLYELHKICDNNICSFIVPSQPLKQVVMNHFGINENKIHVVKDGIAVDAVPLFDYSTVAKTRKTLNADNKIIVTYVGTASFFHGFYDLLQAFKIAKAKEPRLFLLLIVPYREYTIKSLQKMGLKSSDICVLGSMPRKEIYHYLQASDVLILPHRAGTQFDYLSSNKLLDYLAAGKPVVSYALPSVVDTVRNYPFKILVEPNMPEKLAEGILDASELFSEMHVDGTKYVEAYDWHNIGKTLSMVYSEVLECYSGFSG